jgi:hypothetical protein
MSTPAIRTPGICAAHGRLAIQEIALFRDAWGALASGDVKDFDCAIAQRLG